MIENGVVNNNITAAAIRKKVMISGIRFIKSVIPSYLDYTILPQDLYFYKKYGNIAYLQTTPPSANIHIKKYIPYCRQ